MIKMTYCTAERKFFQQNTQNIAELNLTCLVFCYNRAMDKDILNEVIEAEKDIQQCIEQEQVRLRDWLDGVKKEAAEAVARAERNDGESLGRSLEEAKRDAEMRAKQTVESAEARAARYQDLEDTVLTEIIMKRLPRILLE